MAMRQDVEKRRVWAERLGRYRASGLTVARFCAGERVSAKTFYYWAKRLGAISKSSSPVNAAERREWAGRPRVAAEIAPPAIVRFRFNAAVEVSVPADCLDALRCLTQCIQHSRAESSGAFQEVVVAER